MNDLINRADLLDHLNECLAKSDGGTPITDAVLVAIKYAVEQMPSECDRCGYKFHSERISELHDCNDCGKKSKCEYEVRPGEYCRINCPHWEEGNR